MKKFMMCLLSLTVILSGCVQQEQPEEPPVVDKENEKLPEENIDDSSIEETQENKENSVNLESKELTDVENKNGETDSTNDKDNENDDSFQQSDFINFKETILLYDILEITSYSVNYEGIARKVNSRATIEIPKLLFDSEDAKEFNQYYEELSNNCINQYWKAENGILEAHLLNIETFINNDILSIVIKYDPYIYGAESYYSRYEIYNFSLITGNRLTSNEIIQSLNLNSEELQNQINDNIKSYELCTNIPKHIRATECIYEGKEDEHENHKINSTNIEYNNHLYIKNENTLEIYIFIFGAYHRYEKIIINY